METDGRNWYTVKEFADLLQVQPETVYRWSKKGYVKTMQVTPRRTGVPASEYERYLRGELLKETDLTAV